MKQTTLKTVFNCIQTAMAVAACGAIVTPASANITGGDVTFSATGGVFVELNVPFTQSNPDSTVNGDTFNNPNLYAFNEKQNVVLDGPLAVDDIGGGMAGVLAAGTVVSSHYVFFDPNDVRQQIGFVTFDGDIVGLMTSTTTLADSAFLANDGVTYLNAGVFGLEPEDTVTFSGNTLNVNWFASTPGDYIRVLTVAAIPEPESWAMLLAGLGLVGWAARRRS